ncbi:hypothetical protein Tco_0627223 [Tanacetum coccineum]|uniref:Uncharacterized protein n=1 Tax=Tanacetum coccineum TaxID=301880 RepID=A0ABQ4WLT4_9ASTR
MRRTNTFTPMESDVDRTVPKIAAESSKRDAEEELDQESSKRQKIGESSQQAKEPRDKEPAELSQEELQQMMIIVPEEGMNIEALQTKYPIIDWELKRLFEPDADDELWKSQKHIHDVTWRLYDTCGCIKVSTKMLVLKLLVEQDNEMSRELTKIFMGKVERKKMKFLEESSQRTRF